MPNDLLTRIPASRVPITDVADGTVTREWYRYLFNLFTITGGGQANSAASSSMGQDLAPLYTPQLEDKRHGVFFDTTTQTAAVINTAYPITFNTTDITDGVYIGTQLHRKCYVDRIGTYNFQFSAQLNKSGCGSGNTFISGIESTVLTQQTLQQAVTLAGSDVQQLYRCMELCGRIKRR
jgi:hypothetical protein